MDRRLFMQWGLVTGATGLLVSAPALAETGGATLDSKMAGGVYFTKNKPGRWSKKVGGHLPKIQKKGATKDGKIEIEVLTAHPMDGWKHYIVKHVLLDKNFEFIDEKMFDPTKDKAPLSTFTIEDYKGPLYVLSVCNKHDTWIDGIIL